MKIIGAKVYTKDHVFEQRDICTSMERISDRSGDNIVIDATGLIAIPGLVDIHFHGAVGHDFCDADPEGLRAIAEFEAGHGILAICPATMTLDEERLSRIVMTAKDYSDSWEYGSRGARLVGINLEGPFISADRIGAQNPRFLRLPDIELFESLQKESGGLIKLLDVAPELPGCMELIEKLSGRVNISIAHTNSDYDTACEAFSKGAGHMTHLFNAMPGISHRQPGPIIAAWEHGAEVELIADGIHIHPAVVRFVFDLFEKDRICLISDSMEATGLGDGKYELGAQKVTVSGKRAVLSGSRDTIAGSVVNLFDCMTTAVKEMGIPLELAVMAASENPARSIGIFDDYGSIEPGKLANIVLIDESMAVKGVINHGNTQK